MKWLLSIFLMVFLASPLLAEDGSKLDSHVLVAPECIVDMKSLCGDDKVQRVDVLACLSGNYEKLSGECQDYAKKFIQSKSNVPSGMLTISQALDGVRTAKASCSDEITKWCVGYEPYGDLGLLRCLFDNKNKLEAASPGCQKTIHSTVESYGLKWEQVKKMW